MTQYTYPTRMIDAFIKEAKVSTQPFVAGGGVRDAGKSSQTRKRVSGGQTYAQPAPSAYASSSSLVASQKITPPPAT